MKNRSLVLLLICCCSSCYHIREGEHAEFTFENNSQDTVYVDNWIWIWDSPDMGVRSEYVFHVRKESCGVPPGTIKSVCVLAFNNRVTSYEYAFTKTKKCIVYAVPFYERPTNLPKKPLYDYKMVSYELTLDDLIALDFHLAYPPDERMKNVKMDPAYETFHP